jgi:cadmium resistance protein CadD (predicted permease)
LGFFALVAISFTGYFARLVVPREWIGLLGIVPVALGVKKLVEWKRSEHHSSSERPAGASVLSVAAVTFANGGDNIGIYAPLFASSEAAQLGVVLGVFFILIAVWCALGYYLGNHPAAARVLDRYGHIIVPFVLIGLGVYILYESATFHLIPIPGGE